MGSKGACRLHISYSKIVRCQTEREDKLLREQCLTTAKWSFVLYLFVCWFFYSCFSFKSFVHDFWKSILIEIFCQHISFMASWKCNTSAKSLPICCFELIFHIIITTSFVSHAPGTVLRKFPRQNPFHKHSNNNLSSLFQHLISVIEYIHDASWIDFVHANDCGMQKIVRRKFDTNKQQHQEGYDVFLHSHPPLQLLNSIQFVAWGRAHRIRSV